MKIHVEYDNYKCVTDFGINASCKELVLELDFVQLMDTFKRDGTQFAFLLQYLNTLMTKGPMAAVAEDAAEEGPYTCKGCGDVQSRGLGSRCLSCGFDNTEASAADIR